MTVRPNLFSEFGLKLDYRITMVPLFPSMAGSDGAPSDIMPDHYRERGASGPALTHS